MHYKPYELVRKSLLFTLSKKDIESLIIEEKLKKDGFKINYFLDTHDIIQYAFPLGINPGLKMERNAYLVADIHLGYQFLFKYSDLNLILPKNYIEEANRVFSFALEVAKNNYRDLDVEIDLIFDQLNKSNGEFFQSTAVDLIKNNLSLVAYIILELAGESIKRFDYVLSEKLKAETSEFKKVGVNPELYKTIIDLFENIITIREKRYGRKLYSKRYNAQSDSLVLSKIISSNKKLKKKTINFYFSSSDWSHPVVDRLKEFWPEYQGRKFSFLRSQKHTFAQFVLNEMNPDQRIKFYNEILELLGTMDKVNDLDQRRILLAKLSQFVEDERNSFENYGIIRRYSDLRDELEKAVNSSMVSRVEGRDYFLDTLQTVKSHLADDSNLKLYTSKLDLKLLHLNFFDNLLDQIQSERGFTERNFGVDPIISIKQQLPIIFNQRSFEDNGYIQELIDDIKRFYLNKKPKPTDIKKFKTSLLNSTVLSDGDDFTSEFTKLLAYLIVPKSSDNDSPNLKIMSRVEEIIEDCRIISPDKYKQLKGSIFREFRYIQVWAARRVGNFMDSLELSKKYSKVYSNDPRFVHGKCLASYCLASEIEDSKEESDNTKLLKHLNNSIKSAYEAIQGYEEFIRNGQKEAIQGKEVLLNTLSFLEVKKSVVTGLKDHLIIGRKMIIELKNIVLSQEDDYQKYPEYLSTEAYIELHESELEHDPSVKLGHALKSITKAISLCHEYNYPKKSIGWLESLKEEILFKTR